VSTLAKIEEEIAKLPAEEFSELLRRMQERDAAAWDREIEEDAKSGRLDALHARLQKEDGDEPEVSLDDFVDEAELPKTG
jgi:predicted nucleic acid-binding protein